MCPLYILLNQVSRANTNTSLSPRGHFPSIIQLLVFFSHISQPRLPPLSSLPNFHDTPENSAAGLPFDPFHSSQFRTPSTTFTLSLLFRQPLIPTSLVVKEGLTSTSKHQPQCVLRMPERVAFGYSHYFSSYFPLWLSPQSRSPHQSQMRT